MLFYTLVLVAWPLCRCWTGQRNEIVRDDDQSIFSCAGMLVSCSRRTRGFSVMSFWKRGALLRKLQNLRREDGIRTCHIPQLPATACRRLPRTCKESRLPFIEGPTPPPKQARYHHHMIFHTSLGTEPNHSLHSCCGYDLVSQSR